MSGARGQAQTPSSATEFGEEDTWHPHLYDFTQPEVARLSFNDPDKSLFLAPPV